MKSKLQGKAVSYIESNGIAATSRTLAYVTGHKVTFPCTRSFQAMFAQKEVQRRGDIQMTHNCHSSFFFPVRLDSLDQQLCTRKLCSTVTSSVDLVSVRPRCPRLGEGTETKQERVLSCLYEVELLLNSRLCHNSTPASPQSPPSPILFFPSPDSTSH